MEWLLKIIEGPMNGAEIALVSGLRVRVGSATDCDIVLADASLPEAAFELDVTTDAVSFVRGDETKTLTPYEIFEVGTSGFAVGPADGPWAELRRPKAAASDSGEATSPSLQKDASPSATDADVDAAARRVEKEESSPSDDASGTSRSRRSGCFVGLIVFLLLLVGVIFAIWYFWPKIVEKCPEAETVRVSAVERIRGWFSAARGQKTPAVAVPTVTLAEIAVAHRLDLDLQPQPKLSGNVARRTERLAIRALAQAADPSVKFDLTDDETLATAAGELLFVVTEGAIKVASASNRVVTLVGYAPSAASLERTIRALNADVRGLENVLTKGVVIGGTPPSNAPKAVFSDDKSIAKASRSRGTKVAAAKDFPIAGILTKPYPTVVMNNGMRLAEGAQLGNAVIERIEADRLVLRSGATTFEWKP